jgi:hypothetical protein
MDIQSYFLFVNQTYAAMGDLNNDFNKTKIEVNDGGEQIIQSAANFSFYDNPNGLEAVNLTGTDFSRSATNGTASGETFHLGANGELVVHTTVGTADAYIERFRISGDADYSEATFTDVNLTINKSQDNSRKVYVDVENGVIYLGDVDSVSSGTKLIVDADTGEISMEALSVSVISDQDISFQSSEAVRSQGKSICNNVNGYDANSAGRIDVPIPDAPDLSAYATSVNGIAAIGHNITVPIPAVPSGTYTPTMSSGLSSITSLSATEFNYSRVGNAVTVSGQILINTTVTNAIGFFSMTLPIATSVYGSSNKNGSGGVGVSIQASSGTIGVIQSFYILSGNSLQLKVKQQETGVINTFSFSLTYLV